MTAALLGGALLAGLVGSPHCLAMCGGLATAGSGSVAEGVAWHAGRLFTYAALGAAAGAFGAVLPGPPWLPLVLAAAFLLFFALRLAGVSVGTGRLAARLHPLGAAAARAVRGRGWTGRLAFGAVTGLLPCGLVYAALALPVASGSAAAGALAMVAFGLGTVPALVTATAGLRRLATASLRARRALAALVFLCGVGALAWRAPALGVSPDPGAPPPCHHAP